MDEIRITPYHLEAEQCVIGAMLFDSECVGQVMQLVKPDDFYDPRNKEIFEAVLDLFDADKPVELLTVGERLKQRASFDQIGGSEYLVYVANSVATSANVNYHAKMVADYSVRRNLISAANDIASYSYKGEEEVEQILDISEHRIFEIAQKKDISGFTHVKQILSANFAYLSKLAMGQIELQGVKSGYRDLDRYLTSMLPGTFNLIAARPSMGKTSFALNIAANVAVQQKQPVAVFSLEMSKEEIVNRLWSSEALIAGQKLKTGQLTDEDWKSLANTLNILSQSKVFVDDSPSPTVLELRAKCRRLKSEHGLGLIIIDHIQLMRAARQTDSRQHELTEISRGLKILAKDLGVPVLALSQLSRASAGRTDKRPLLSDLRDSGAIEQDADMVMMLYRDEYYNKDTEDVGIAECIVAKNRNGEVGTVKLRWLPEYTRFATLEPEYGQ